LDGCALGYECRAEFTQSITHLRLVAPTLLAWVVVKRYHNDPVSPLKSAVKQRGLHLDAANCDRRHARLGSPIAFDLPLCDYDRHADVNFDISPVEAIPVSQIKWGATAVSWTQILGATLLDGA
jgi:hypothetical protein